MTLIDELCYWVGATVILSLSLAIVGASVLFAFECFKFVLRGIVKETENMWWSVAWMAWKKRKGKEAKHFLRLAIERDEMDGDK